MIKLIEKGVYKEKAYEVYLMENASGASVKVTNIGCAIMQINVPDASGALADVVLGYDRVSDYIDRPKYFGAVIGRVGNRIRSSRFVLDGKEYHVTPTSPDGTSLHGGIYGFDTKAFSAHIGTHEGREALIMEYTSPNGEEGFPGELKLTVTYTFSDDCALLLDYRATTDSVTVCNITNHSFFNLNGHSSGNVLGNRLWLDAGWYTPTDAGLNTTGEILSVHGTALDFTEEHVVGERIDNDEEPLRLAGGYDHNYVINVTDPGQMKTFAKVVSESGRTMEVSTNAPGVQLYSGNFLDGVQGKDGAVYNRRNALCLETQYFPGCVSFPHFPSCRLERGEEYHVSTVYKFGC